MSEVQVLREIAPSARVAADAEVGPYCVVGPEVTIGPGTVLTRRVSVLGRTTLGANNVVGEACVLGTIPQDLKYAGAPTLLIVGSRNWMGPRVTMHIGTEYGGYVTRVGDDNVFHTASHVSHDCFIDDHVTLGHGVLLAGHVRVHSGVVIEDLAGAHHFVTIGRGVRVGPRTPIRRDVPPFTDFYSDDPEQTPPGVRGVHYAGVRAAALSAAEEAELLRVMGELFDDEAALQTKIEQLEKIGVEGAAAELCEFVHHSLGGVYGRSRELIRGQIPPEAVPYLTPELQAAIRRPGS
jgi:UDP-N-acetylglucosamine acyltransferase